MKKLFKNRGVIGLIIFVIILSVVVGFISATNHDVTFVENVVQVIVTPVQKLFMKTGDKISDFFDYFSDIDKLKNEITELKNNNAQLQNELDKAEISLLENDELRKLLLLKKEYPELEFNAAQVVAREPSNWYNTFVIDKGAVDGIALNQPVVSVDKTLVGRISEVGTTWARVITLNDPGHSAGAEIVRSGEYGIVDGDSTFSTKGTFKLSFISKNANIVVGDRVVTSGLGGIYPPGLTIGKVLEIRPDLHGISQYAVVAPEANIEKIKNVLIITNSEENF